MRQPSSSQRARVLRLGLVVVAVFAQPAATAQPAAPVQCQASGPVVRIPELPEASGIAISHRTPGRLWAHNDSGNVLVALDTRGTVTGRVTVSGMTVQDWEAVAVGACPTGSCIYLADIGDNVAKRKRITIYRVREPATEDSVAITDMFHATYPDGAHDAETLLVLPDGALFIVTKGETGAIGLYRFPRELRPGATHPLELVGRPRASGKLSQTSRITDGAVSPDGTWVVLRHWTDAGRVDLTPLGEAQGEGIAMAADGTVYVTGEGGRKAQPGTFATYRCAVSSQDRRPRQ
jgi:hypothetical protein